MVAFLSCGLRAGGEFFGGAVLWPWGDNFNFYIFPNFPEICVVFTTDTKDPTTTLDKTAVEAVAASSGAIRYDVERPEEKDHIKVSDQVIRWQHELCPEIVEICNITQY